MTDETPVQQDITECNRRILSLEESLADVRQVIYTNQERQEGRNATMDSFVGNLKGRMGMASWIIGVLLLITMSVMGWTINRITTHESISYHEGTPLYVTKQINKMRGQVYTEVRDVEDIAKENTIAVQVIIERLDNLSKQLEKIDKKIDKL